MNDLIKYQDIDLKQKLDEIDAQIYRDVFDGFYESRLKILMAMWKKGEVISEFTLPKNGKINYLELERQTGRTADSLKKWHDLYVKYPDWREYSAIAETKAKDWTQKVLAEKESSNILALKHTGEQENYTPQKVIESVKAVLGSIDLDPASCDFAQGTIQADAYFTEEDNGLSKSWYGNVFLNPPYQMPRIREFTDKLIQELPNIKAAILLTNNNTDTIWFHKCVQHANLVCFTKGRIGFYTATIEKTAPTNGQAFFYFGDNEEKFIEVFSDIGLIMRKISYGQ